MLRVDKTNIAVDRLNIPPEDIASPAAMRIRLKAHNVNSGMKLRILHKRRLPTKAEKAITSGAKYTAPINELAKKPEATAANSPLKLSCEKRAVDA